MSTHHDVSRPEGHKFVFNCLDCFFNLLRPTEALCTAVRIVLGQSKCSHSSGQQKWHSCIIRAGRCFCRCRKASCSSGSNTAGCNAGSSSSENHGKDLIVRGFCSQEIKHEHSTVTIRWMFLLFVGGASGRSTVHVHVQYSMIYLCTTKVSVACVWRWGSLEKRRFSLSLRLPASVLPPSLPSFLPQT
jgi:hypothetical protein